jgi:membrane protease YdiL (CAAX protease family)
MLQGLSRYISFGWAALIQAAVFALLHESLAAMPIIFLLGYLAAWLVKRTGGLLAPILMHVMNNTFAYNGIVLVSSVMNGRG